ncbi:MAG: glycosyltransferase family 2 protein [Muribaculaceae bacterium]|nr:glycosyltransferase family 2 protein [Muribaculaceae bacterium]
MKISCVVVTYNRLSLLKECISAIAAQTVKPQSIYIVDNCSTDATPQYLESLSVEGSDVIVVSLDKNTGGAGGFSVGIDRALSDKCDYVWIMDDDTIPSPTALEHLVNALQRTSNTGFACSKVLWTDGTPSVMNPANFLTGKGSTLPVNYYSDGNGLFLARSCSFVSVIFNAEIFYKIGLPYAEFFIWCDDEEFTLRATNAGYTNFYVDQSVVTHKTATNYSFDISQAPDNAAWRFYYQARNSLFMKRSKHNRVAYIFTVLNRYRKYCRLIHRRPADSRKQFIIAVKRGCRDALTFNPVIKFPSR